MPGDRRLARGELGSKTRDFSAPAKHAAPDPGTMLRKRLREEMEAIQGILKKAELLARSSKDVNQGRAAPRRGKDGRFVAAEATTKKVDRAPCAKKQETMPPPPVEVIEPQIMDADRVPCAKKMKMAPSVEIVKPRIVQEIIKPKIVEVNQTPCAKKMKRAPSVEIVRPRIVEEIVKPQIVEVNQTPCAKKMKRAPSVEIVKPQIMEEIIKPLIVEVNQTPCAKKRKIVPTVEIIEPQVSEDEVFSLIDRLSTFGSDMPVPILEFLNKECTGHPNEKAGEILINLGSMRRSAMFELLKLLDEFGEEEKCRQQKEEPKNECKSINLSLKRELEDGEVIEEEEEPIIICDDVCPIATKLAEITNSPSNSSSSSSSGSSSSSSSSGSSSSSSSSSGSSSSSNTSSGSSCSDSSDSDSSESDSDDECMTSNPAPVVLRQTGTSPTAMAHKLLSPVAEEEFVETRNNQSSCSSLLEEGEIEEQECHVVAEKFAETVNSEPMEPQPGAQGKAHDLYARAFEKTRERRRAYEKLEEMERNAKPIFDCIPPRHLRQLGITPSVEYAVTSERCARTCDSPVQSLLGFFLKAE